MLNDGRSHLFDAPHVVVFPAAADDPGVIAAPLLPGVCTEGLAPGVADPAELTLAALTGSPVTCTCWPTWVRSASKFPVSV